MNWVYLLSLRRPSVVRDLLAVSMRVCIRQNQMELVIVYRLCRIRFYSCSYSIDTEVLAFSIGFNKDH